MKQTDVKIGETYLVKVAGNLAAVQITKDHPSGKGWEGKSVKTGKTIRIASAQRLRKQLSVSTSDTPKPVHTDAKPTTDTTKAAKRDTGQRVATGDKPMSLIDAAVHILAQGKQDPMRCKEIVEQAVSQNLWQPQSGKTPANTLYASILREIKTKGDDSRFHKAKRGMFTVTQKGA
jgi:hypothetical protein